MRMPHLISLQRFYSQELLYLDLKAAAIHVPGAFRYLLSLFYFLISIFQLQNGQLPDDVDASADF
jgi:hypothetical protein